MIMREEAVEVLYDLISSGILSEEIEEKLQDIASCIEAENIGRHEWGVPREELGKLYASVRVDLITEDSIEDYERIHRKLTFLPSVDERIVVESNIADRIENATGEEAKVEDIERWFKRF